MGKGEQEDTYDGVVLDAVRLAPGRHHERVVECYHHHLVDALLLQLRQQPDVSRDMLVLARRREGARDRHEDDLLVLELCFRVEVGGKRVS